MYRITLNDGIVHSIGAPTRAGLREAVIDYLDLREGDLEFREDDDGECLAYVAGPNIAYIRCMA